MTRRLSMNLALALAGAFALTAALPTFACDCDHKKDAKAAKSDKDKGGDAKTAPADKSAKPAAEKKADAGAASDSHLAGGCDCGAKDPKDCKCGSGCKCTDKTEKPKASVAKASKVLLAGGCNCEKGGKNCTCPKGDCKCSNCSDTKLKAKAA